MDVSVPFLGTKYQNLWENKANKTLQMDNNIEFFLHAEMPRDVIKRSHRVTVATVHIYIAFINFQDDVHNTILESKQDPAK